MILIGISIFILGQDHNSRISWIAKEIKVIFPRFILPKSNFKYFFRTPGIPGSPGYPVNLGLNSESFELYLLSGN